MPKKSSRGNAIGYYSSKSGAINAADERSCFVYEPQFICIIVEQLSSTNGQTISLTEAEKIAIKHFHTYTKYSFIDKQIISITHTEQYFYAKTYFHY